MAIFEVQWVTLRMIHITRERYEICSQNHCISFLHKVHRFTHEEIKVVHGKRIKYFALEIHHRVYVGKK